MAVKIKLMADYECSPLWWADVDKVGDINLDAMPLSKETIASLEKWADIYNAKLNREDPASSGFSTPEAEVSFEKEGISLWKQLQKELAPDYEVLYFSEHLRKVITDINELKLLPFSLT